MVYLLLAMVYLLLSVGFCHIWGPPCCFCAALSLVARFQNWRFLIFMKETLMTLNSQSVACSLMTSHFQITS